MDWASMLEDKNVQQLMAGIGTALDPQGAGGIIGQPTQDMIAVQGQQNHLQELLKALGSEGKLSIKPDGSMSMQTGKAPEAASALGGLGGMDNLGSQDPMQHLALNQSPAAGQQTQQGKQGGFQNLIDQIYQNLFGGM